MIFVWCARVAWVSLPLTTGDALADAIGSWSDAPALVAAVLAWSAWAIGLVALLAPRPWGVTCLRVAAPAAVACALAAIGPAGTASAALAVSSAVVAASFALSAPVSMAAASALAYGDEVRFPLRVPPPLLATVVPVAVAVVAAGVTAGPLLLADGRWAAGALAVVVGVPGAAFAARSLHSLARRWFVLVPAGFVVVDPLLLLDPVLVRREQVARLGRASGTAPAGEVLDVRLGAGPGIRAVLREPVTVGRRAGRRDGVLVTARTLLVAPVCARRALAEAARRRLPVEPLDEPARPTR